MQRPSAIQWLYKAHALVLFPAMQSHGVPLHGDLGRTPKHCESKLASIAGTDSLLGNASHTATQMDDWAAHCGGGIRWALVHSGGGAQCWGHAVVLQMVVSWGIFCTQIPMVDCKLW